MENKVKMISELLFHYFSHNGIGLSGIPNRINVKSISTWGLKWTRSVDRLQGSVLLSSCAQTDPRTHKQTHTFSNESRQRKLWKSHEAHFFPFSVSPWHWPFCNVAPYSLLVSTCFVPSHPSLSFITPTLNPLRPISPGWGERGSGVEGGAPVRPIACGIISAPLPSPLLYRIVGKPVCGRSPGGLLLFITKETTQQNHLTSGPHGPAMPRVCVCVLEVEGFSSLKDS